MVKCLTGKAVLHFYTGWLPGWLFLCILRTLIILQEFCMCSVFSALHVQLYCLLCELLEWLVGLSSHFICRGIHLFIIYYFSKLSSVCVFFFYLSPKVEKWRLAARCFVICCMNRSMIASYGCSTTRTKDRWVQEMPTHTRYCIRERFVTLNVYCAEFFY